MSFRDTVAGEHRLGYARQMDGSVTTLFARAMNDTEDLRKIAESLVAQAVERLRPRSYTPDNRAFELPEQIAEAGVYLRLAEVVLHRHREVVAEEAVRNWPTIDQEEEETPCRR
jgi:hypothetical protein